MREHRRETSGALVFYNLKKDMKKAGDGNRTPEHNQLMYWFACDGDSLLASHAPMRLGGSITPQPLCHVSKNVKTLEFTRKIQKKMTHEKINLCVMCQNVLKEIE